MSFLLSQPQQLRAQLISAVGTAYGPHVILKAVGSTSHSNIAKTHSEFLTGMHFNFSNHTCLYLVRGSAATRNQPTSRCFFDTTVTATTSMQKPIGILELIQQ